MFVAASASIFCVSFVQSIFFNASDITIEMHSHGHIFIPDFNILYFSRNRLKSFMFTPNYGKRISCIVTSVHSVFIFIRLVSQDLSCVAFLFAHWGLLCFMFIFVCIAISNKARSLASDLAELRKNIIGFCYFTQLVLTSDLTMRSLKTTFMLNMLLKTLNPLLNV